ncbi:putative hemolysin [Agrobacterium larrymoorei]|uniref:Hemolysin n=1 Tax=Agrobacterium larrymoorei TaxID=160699 RepID=A0AAJ2BI64_9HYPH|nr:DUF333 domain-containing protein [Agrobacterium larrymoorei]MDQ1186939.1 putative hemolysin [Agrobacterium larrymoorei]MDR6103219.1 putative hemolysin [Agrobacterium larrymoorei]
MKKILVAVSFSATVFALASSAMAMSNPASDFCEEMGGRSVSAKLSSGDEIGLCYLAKDKIVEEWTLFRMFDGEVPSESENPFLGK